MTEKRKPSRVENHWIIIINSIFLFNSTEYGDWKMNIGFICSIIAFAHWFCRNVDSPQIFLKSLTEVYTWFFHLLLLLLLLLSIYASILFRILDALITFIEFTEENVLVNSNSIFLLLHFRKLYFLSAQRAHFWMLRIFLSLSSRFLCYFHFLLVDHESLIILRIFSGNVTSIQEKSDGIFAISFENFPLFNAISRKMKMKIKIKDDCCWSILRCKPFTKMQTLMRTNHGPKTIMAWTIRTWLLFCIRFRFFTSSSRSSPFNRYFFFTFSIPIISSSSLFCPCIHPISSTHGNRKKAKRSRAL